jgi:hypothetical protein
MTIVHQSPHKIREEIYVFLLVLGNLQHAKNPSVYQLVYDSIWTVRRNFFVFLFTKLDVICKRNQHTNPLSLKEEYFTLKIKSDFPKQTAIILVIRNELHHMKDNRSAV